MMIYVHSFDWITYTEHVMPAFARWLIEDNDLLIYQLYEKTRCARGEQFFPPAVRHLCTWPRAQAFVHLLPRGPQAAREYQKLCIPEQFTALSDRYLHQFTPQLYPTSEALRFVWGAIVEQYCLSWSQLSETDDEQEIQAANELETTHSDLITLLYSTGLHDLAQQVSEQANGMRQTATDLQRIVEHKPQRFNLDDLDFGEEVLDTTENGPKGIEIGRPTTILHLRGWLASISVRAMALFEFLACGRRSMPFGHQAGEPFGKYIGYLTPSEVSQLADCLRNAQPPDQMAAEADYQRFRLQAVDGTENFRLIDEVLPTHAAPFLQAVRKAARQNLGLICSED